MTSTIESVDNLPKLPVHDRVSETEKSSPEDQRKQFKKALKNTMQKDQRKDESRHETDSVDVETSGSDHEQTQQQSTAKHPASDREEINKESQPKTSAVKHINMKA
ncbi:MAG: hypothetical protein ACE5K8_01210 [Candidatus Zixiibacteriota bacterium]